MSVLNDIDRLTVTKMLGKPFLRGFRKWNGNDVHEITLDLFKEQLIAFPYTSCVLQGNRTLIGCTPTPPPLNSELRRDGASPVGDSMSKQTVIASRIYKLPHVPVSHSTSCIPSVYCA